LLYKIFNNLIPRKDWLDLNFQMINTRRQIFFEVQNRSVYRVGNNILTNRLSCLNRKVTLDMLNLPIEPYKIKCKDMFLLWSVFLNLWIYLKVVLCSSCNDVLMYIDGGTINLFETKNRLKIFKSEYE
jgi:hypothetical protein